MFRRLAFTNILFSCYSQLAFLPSAAAPIPSEKSALTLRTAHPAAKPGNAKLLIFEGTSTTPIHRPGPEHFKLTRLSDGKVLDLSIAYERDALDDEAQGCPRSKTEKTRRASKEVISYNYLFKSVRLSLDTGPFDAKDEKRSEGQLELFGRTKLQAGTRYRLTWARWPVGAKEATELTCEFEVEK